MGHDEKPSNGHAYRTAPAPRFEAWVDYTPVTLEGMKRLFPEYRLTHRWHGLKDVMEFEPTEECKDVSRLPRMVTFEYVCLEGRFKETAEIPYSAALDEMKILGLRPALPEEEKAFLAQYPDEQLRHPVTALGAKDRNTDSYFEAGAYASMGPGVPGCWLTPASQKNHCHTIRYLAVRETPTA